MVAFTRLSVNVVKMALYIFLHIFVFLHMEKPSKTKDFKKQKVREEIYKSLEIAVYNCLVNNQIDNLITVGRCISTTFEAQGVIRTTPIVGAVAQAGGAAAFLAVKYGQKAKDINIQEMQQILLNEGAYLNINAMK